MLLFRCVPKRPPHIGIKVRTLTADLRKQHKLPDDARGALVTVVNSSPAKEKGIVAGDVILEADGKPVGSANRIAAISASGAGTIALRVILLCGFRYQQSPVKDDEIHQP